LGDTPIKNDEILNALRNSYAEMPDPSESLKDFDWDAGADCDESDEIIVVGESSTASVNTSGNMRMNTPLQTPVASNNSNLAATNMASNNNGFSGMNFSNQLQRQVSQQSHGAAQNTISQPGWAASSQQSTNRSMLQQQQLLQQQLIQKQQQQLNQQQQQTGLNQQNQSSNGLSSFNLQTLQSMNNFLGGNGSNSTTTINSINSNSSANQNPVGARNASFGGRSNGQSGIMPVTQQQQHAQPTLLKNQSSGSNSSNGGPRKPVDMKALARLMQKRVPSSKQPLRQTSALDTAASSTMSAQQRTVSISSMSTNSTNRKRALDESSASSSPGGSSSNGFTGKPNADFSQVPAVPLAKRAASEGRRVSLSSSQRASSTATDSFRAPPVVFTDVLQGIQDRKAALLGSNDGEATGFEQDDPLGKLLRQDSSDVLSALSGIGSGAAQRSASVGARPQQQATGNSQWPITIKPNQPAGNVQGMNLANLMQPTSINPRTNTSGSTNLMAAQVVAATQRNSITMNNRNVAQQVPATVNSNNNMIARIGNQWANSGMPSGSNGSMSSAPVVMNNNTSRQGSSNMPSGNASMNSSFQNSRSSSNNNKSSFDDLMSLLANG